MTNGGGGVIKDNEVFDNDFDGICLATGVSPFLSGKYKYRSVGLFFMGSCFSLALNVNDCLSLFLSLPLVQVTENTTTGRHLMKQFREESASTQSQETIHSQCMISTGKDL